MSPFTDKDFERLKEFKIKYQYFNFPTAWDVNEAYDLIEALLARLEAAEEALEKATPFFDMHPTRIGGVTRTGIHIFTDAYWTWRRSCGK